MTEDPRLARLAELVVGRMLRVDGGSLVMVGPSYAAPIYPALARHAAARGAHVLTSVSVPGVDVAVVEASSIETLRRTDELQELLSQHADYLVRIDGDDDEQRLARQPGAKLAARLAGRHASAEVRMARGADERLRWAVVMYPSAEQAAEADMEPDAFADLVYRAAKCDGPDPDAAWDDQAAWQDRLRAQLEAGRELHLLGDGTDLRLTVGGRTWRSSAARRNIPDGEVFTGPLETSAEGIVTFTYPAAYQGIVAEGIRLTFAAGEVVEATAERGQEALDAALGIDAGARRLGEVGIGTNFGLDRFTSHVLLDEKIGGTIHLALGRGYPETGSQNQSAIHWDIVCDLRSGGEIRLDGETIQRDGVFVDASYG